MLHADRIRVVVRLVSHGDPVTYAGPVPPGSAGGLWVEFAGGIMNQGGCRLLVSVRDADEARAAMTGGCDLLDIKDPAHGSLGMADRAPMIEIAEVAKVTTLSAAFGEARDWLNDEPIPIGLPRFDYCKLGTAGLAGIRGWQDDWMQVRRRFESSAAHPINWIAVAYADWEPAEAPSPAEMLQAAIATNCAGLLIDTFVKQGRSVFDFLAEVQLREAIDRAQDSGLLVALAGLCTLEDARKAVEFLPDIIAVRTLACAGQQRAAAIDSVAVARLRDVITAGGGG